MARSQTHRHCNLSERINMAQKRARFTTEQAVRMIFEGEDSSNYDSSGDSGGESDNSVLDPDFVNKLPTVETDSSDSNYSEPEDNVAEGRGRRVRGRGRGRGG